MAVASRLAHAEHKSAMDTAAIAVCAERMILFPVNESASFDVDSSRSYAIFGYFTSMYIFRPLPP